MDERIIVYQARLNTYALLQRLFQDAPDASLLRWLADERPFASFPIELEDEARLALSQADAALQTADEDVLRRDFRQLFIGPGPMTAPPWESVYRNEEHLLFDQHTLQVREAYARHGMEFVNIYKMPEDSIAIELEFMKVLTERLLHAVEADDQKAEEILLKEQQQFLRQHLLIWVPRFTALIHRSATTSVYRALADILGGYLKWDDLTIQVLLDTIVEEKANA